MDWKKFGDFLKKTLENTSWILKIALNFIVNYCKTVRDLAVNYPKLSGFLGVVALSIIGYYFYFRYLPFGVVLALSILVPVVGLTIVFWKTLCYGCINTEKLESGLTPSGAFVSKIAIPLLGVVGGTLVFGMTFMQFQSQSQQTEKRAEEAKQQFQAQMAQLTIQAENTSQMLENTKRQVSAEQFKNAIEHLGSEKQAVVLGGIHALHNLASNNKDTYSQPVFEVLCSFIREETNKPAYKKQFPGDAETQSQGIQVQLFPFQIGKKNVEKPDTDRPTSLIVIQTIVDKLFRDESSREVYQLLAANLRGANFQGIDLQGMVFGKSNLQGVNLQGVNLQEAKLQRANMQNASLHNAELQEAYLHNTELHGANLRDARFQGVKLSNTKFIGANLIGADFRGVALGGSDFRGANLRVVNLQGAVIRGDGNRYENLPDVDLRGVQNNYYWPKAFARK